MLLMLSLMMDYDPNNGRELVPLAPRALEYIVQPQEPLFPVQVNWIVVYLLF